jgi:hypothetical protein
MDKNSTSRKNRTGKTKHPNNRPPCHNLNSAQKRIWEESATPIANTDWE